MRSAAWQGVSCVSRRFFQAYIRKTLSPGLLQFGTARRTDSTQVPLQSRRYRPAEADRRPTCRLALLKESGHSPGLRAPCRDSAGKTQCLPLLRRPTPSPPSCPCSAVLSPPRLTSRARSDISATPRRHAPSRAPIPRSSPRSRRPPSHGQSPLHAPAPTCGPAPPRHKNAPPRHHVSFFSLYLHLRRYGDALSHLNF